MTCSADETFLTGFKKSIHVCLSVNLHMICVFHMILLLIKAIQIKNDAIFDVFSLKWILETIIDAIARAFHGPYWFPSPGKTRKRNIEKMKKNAHKLNIYYVLWYIYNLYSLVRDSSDAMRWIPWPVHLQLHAHRLVNNNKIWERKKYSSLFRILWTMNIVAKWRERNHNCNGAWAWETKSVVSRVNENNVKISGC